MLDLIKVANLNKRVVNKSTTVAVRDDILKYKARGVVENAFANNYHRGHPILTNNYERTVSSYNGLFMFALCATLVKKINKIINEKENKNIQITSKGRVQITKKKRKLCIKKAAEKNKNKKKR